MTGWGRCAGDDSGGALRQGCPFVLREIEGGMDSRRVCKTNLPPQPSY